MTDSLIHRPKATLVMGATILGIALVSLLAGMVPAAKADVQGNMYFCTQVWLQPYGQAGDRCASPLGGYLYAVTGNTVEHSGCVSVLNNIGNVSSTWACTPGGNTAVQKYFPGDGIWRRGIIRNNTTGSGAHMSGSQWCYTCG